MDVNDNFTQSVHQAQMDRIAELEADVAALKHRVEDLTLSSQQRGKDADELYAELAALKARRCGGCTHSAEADGCPVYDAAWATFGVVPFNCCCWDARP